MKKKYSILIVEDERIIAEATKRRLEQFGYNVIKICSTGIDAIETVKTNSVDLVLMDIILKGNMNGLEAGKEIHEKYNIPIIFLTANSNEEFMKQAKVSEAYCFILKPYKKMDLKANIELALYRHEIQKKITSSEKQYRSLVESIREGIGILDDNYRFVYANQALANTLNLSNGHIINREFASFFPEKKHNLIQNLFQIIKQNEAKTIELKYPFSNSENRILQIHFTPVWKEDRCEKIFVLCNDITNFNDKHSRLEKQIEERATKIEEMNKKLEAKVAQQNVTQSELERSKKQYKYLFDNALVGLWQSDVKFQKFQKINLKMAKIFGYKTIQEFMTKSSQEYVFSRNQYQHFYSKLKEFGHIEDFPIEYIMNNGKSRTISFSAKLYPTKNFIEGIAVDITDLVRTERALSDSNEKLQKLLEDTVQGLISAVEIRDPYTAGHQRKVAALAKSIAAELGLEQQVIDGVNIAALVHDIGKIYIPIEILNRPRKLNKAEFDLIQLHPKIGFDLLQPIDFPWPIAKIVCQHHEKLDGSGYPNGIKGEDILLEARILTVADAMEAISSHRPYRASMGIKTALEEIDKKKAILYDPDIVNATIRLFENKNFTFPEASLVKKSYLNSKTVS